jgi:hypothetical protein
MSGIVMDAHGLSLGKDVRERWSVRYLSFSVRTCVGTCPKQTRSQLLDQRASAGM